MNQEELLQIITAFNRDIVGPLLTILLLGTGLYFTLRLRFVQRHYFAAFKHLLKSRGAKADKAKGMTPFQALMTSIASQVGTGNIVGVTTAIVAGGPGAVF